MSNKPQDEPDYKARLITIAQNAVGNERFSVRWKAGYLHVTLDGWDVGTFKGKDAGFAPENIERAESVLGLQNTAPVSTDMNVPVALALVAFGDDNVGSRSQGKEPMPTFPVEEGAWQ